MEIRNAVFVTSMATYREAPPITLPQLAVVGKSNVGKSSLINTLCRAEKAMQNLIHTRENPFD